MNERRYPYRVRLAGGRTVHAARDVSGGPDRVTACDYYLPETARNHNLASGADIECLGCQRQIRREENR